MCQFYAFQLEGELRGAKASSSAPGKEHESPRWPAAFPDGGACIDANYHSLFRAGVCVVPLHFFLIISGQFWESQGQI